MAKNEAERGVQKLFDAIASCLLDAVAFDEVVYRSARMTFANSVDFLSGAGVLKIGDEFV
jgi:hypothetical protein